MISQAVDPEDSGNGSYHRSLTILLMAATDGASQLLVPDPPNDRLRNGAKFQKFIVDNFPLERVSHPRDEVADFVWYGPRNSLVHRFGLRVGTTVTKLGRKFFSDDADFERLEVSPTQLFDDPVYVHTPEKQVIWLEAYYWELRQAIMRALDTAEKADAIHDWIMSEQWDPKGKKGVVM